MNRSEKLEKNLEKNNFDVELAKKIQNYIKSEVQNILSNEMKGFHKNTIDTKFQILLAGSAFLDCAIDKSDFDLVIILSAKVCLEKLVEELKKCKHIYYVQENKDKPVTLHKTRIFDEDVDLVFCEILDETVPENIENAVLFFKNCKSQVAAKGLHLKSSLKSKIWDWPKFTKLTKIIKIFAKGKIFDTGVEGKNSVNY